ncbi:MAG TPA: hypothetical protein V6D14_20880 [Coleofasciculaceae cyanobacterium]|jgi:hypothetical protein
MKKTHEQAISKNRKFDRPKNLAFYYLLSNGWFPVITVGLVTSVLGMIGILPTANAEELPEQPYPKQGDAVTDYGDTDDVSRKALRSIVGLGSAELTRSLDKSLIGQQPELDTEKSPSHPSSITIGKDASPTANLDAAGKITGNSIPLSNLADSFAPRQQAEVQSPQKSEDSVQQEVREIRTPSESRSSNSVEGAKDPLLNSQLVWIVNSPVQLSNTDAKNSQPLSVPKPPNPPTGTVSQNNAPSTPSGATLAANEVRILTPQSGVVASRSTNLAVQYNRDAQIQVRVNQKPLDPSIVTDQQRDATQNLVTQVWYNIPLDKGENTLTVQAGNGTPVSVQLTVKDTTAQIEISPVGNPRVPADGRSVLAFSGQIVDENGQLITKDAVVTLTASSGKFVGADLDKDQAGFQVMARGGQFTAQLQSGLEAQKVRIRAAVDNTKPKTDDRRQETREFPIPDAQYLAPKDSPIEAYTQVEFITNLRPSLVTGSINFRIGAAGTNFWGRRSDFLDPDTINDGTEANLSGAIFATGRIGEWLFTGAYNSDRNLNETCEGTTRLFRGPQFCEQQYPVYGDSSTVDYLTPSTDSVFLRFERTSPVLGAEPDYAMWGDYNTQEFARVSQLFTATTRQLHGFKGNYNIGNLQLTALYSRDIQGFQRDTIAPNGTSGYYFLSRRLVIGGSENIFIETEESDRPGTVIERKLLSRGKDYEIDYDRGSIMFRRPVLATEFGFFTNPTGQVIGGSTLLVRKIVITYQYDTRGGGDTNLYAGRLQYNLSQNFDAESWIAATYLRQDQGIQDFELYGADFRVALGQSGHLIGEYAHSFDNSLFLGGVTGSAYRVEFNAIPIRGLEALAYYRSVEENFTNNATTSYVPGQTRYGGGLSYQLGSSTRLRAGYDHEVNFGIASALRPLTPFDLFNPLPEAPPGSAVNNSLTTINAGIQQQIGAATLAVDYVNRSRDDRVSNAFSGDASQLVSRLGFPLSESLTFRAQNELNLSGNDPLYPNRTTVGLDWGVYPGVTVRLAHQFFDGGLLGSDSITSLDTILEHKLGENTSLTGRYSVISGFNTVTGQGAVGLNHRWVVTPGLRINLGYEHTFSNSSIPTAAGPRYLQPFAFGQSAYSLALLGGDVFNVGFEYTDSPDFKASGRVEHRTGSGNDNTVITAAAAGKLSPALTALARYEQANFANQGVLGLGNSSTLRVGLAYRDPDSDQWNALLRYEYRLNPSTTPLTLLEGTGTGSEEHVFAAEAIYAPSWRWEFYGKGALRNATTYSALNFNNSATVFLSQLRASYRLGYRMDLAVEGRWIGQSAPGPSEVGVAVEAGYYLTPDLRIGVGYSFGSVDDRDFTGYRSKDGPYLSVTFKVNELFGGFGRQRVVPPQQQETRVKPVASEVTSPSSPSGPDVPERSPSSPASTDEKPDAPGGQSNTPITNPTSTDK